MALEKQKFVKNNEKKGSVYTFSRFIRVFPVLLEGVKAGRKYVQYTKMISTVHRAGLITKVSLLRHSVPLEKIN